MKLLEGLDNLVNARILNYCVADPTADIRTAVAMKGVSRTWSAIIGNHLVKLTPTVIGCCAIHTANIEEYPFNKVAPKLVLYWNLTRYWKLAISANRGDIDRAHWEMQQLKAQVKDLTRRLLSSRVDFTVFSSLKARIAKKKAEWRDLKLGVLQAQRRITDFQQKTDMEMWPRLVWDLLGSSKMRIDW